MTVTRNPEDDVCDTIAQLVDESLNHGPTDDYDRPYLERCTLCDLEWHGMTGDGLAGVVGCPGAHATDEQAETWRSWWNPPSPDISPGRVAVSPGYTIADVEAMRRSRTPPRFVWVGWNHVE